MRLGSGCGFKTLLTILCNCYVILFTLQVLLKTNRFEWEKGKKPPNILQFAISEDRAKIKKPETREVISLSSDRIRSFLAIRHSPRSNIPNTARRSVLFFDNFLFIYGD